MEEFKDELWKVLAKMNDKSEESMKRIEAKLDKITNDAIPAIKEKIDKNTNKINEIEEEVKDIKDKN